MARSNPLHKLLMPHSFGNLVSCTFPNTVFRHPVIESLQSFTEIQNIYDARYLKNAVKINSFFERKNLLSLALKERMERLSYLLQRAQLHFHILSTSSQLMVQIHKRFQVSEHIKEHGSTITIRTNF